MSLWAHSQSRGADSGTGANPTLAYSGAVTAGNFLVGCCRIGGNDAATPTLSDSVNGAWNTILRRGFATDHTLGLFWFPNTGAGTPTVTLNEAGGGTKRWVIAEYDAAGNVIVLDQSASDTNISTTPSSGDMITTAASEMLLGVMTAVLSPTITAGSSFTIRQTVASKISLEDRAVGSTGTYVADFGISGVEGWVAAGATFKVSAGGGGGGNPWYYFGQHSRIPRVDRSWEKRGTLWTPSYALSAA